MKQPPGLSRRRVLRAAAVPAAGAFLAEAALAQATPTPDVRVAATILRTEPSRQSARGLRVGVRVSIIGADHPGHTLVMVIDPVEFDVSATELRRQLVSGIQRQVQDRLRRENIELGADRIAVHVFGGPL